MVLLYYALENRHPPYLNEFSKISVAGCKGNWDAVFRIIFDNMSRIFKIVQLRVILNRKFRSILNYVDRFIRYYENQIVTDL